MKKNYFAYLTARDSLQCWGFEVKPETAGDLFTIELANKIIAFANEKYPQQFPDREKEEFNYLKLDMGNGNHGVYYLDKNLLQVYVDGVPVYENRNGKICRDSVAMMDSVGC